MRKISMLCLLITGFVSMSVWAANLPVVPPEMFNEGASFHGVQILQPAIATDSTGNIYVVWAGVKKLMGKRRQTHIYLSKSVDDGQTFQPPIQVNDSDGTAAVGWQLGPQIAVDANDRVYVSYGDFREHRPEIYLTTSTDGGNTFSPSTPVTNGKLKIHEILHAMGVSGDGKIYISWLDKSDVPESDHHAHHAIHVFVARSIDSGKHFDAPINLTAVQKNPVCECCRVSLVVDEAGNVFVAYRNNRNNIRDIYLSASRDEGENWSEPIRVGFGKWQVFRCPADAPVLAADRNGRIHLAWMDARKGTNHVYYNSASTGDLVFRPETERRVSRDTIRFGNSSKAKYGEGGHPAVAIDQTGRVTLAWEVSANATDIHTAVLSADGFSSEKRVNDDDGAFHQAYPVLASYEGKVYAVWADDRFKQHRAYFAVLNP